MIGPRPRAGREGVDTPSQTFQRWIRGRDDVSSMTDVARFDALLALNSSGQPATCQISGG